MLPRPTIRGRDWQGAGGAFAVAMLLGYAVVGFTVAPSFLTKSNLVAVLFSTGILLPVIIATQALLLLGKFDLSLGAQASLYGMLAGVVYGHTESTLVSVIAVIVCASLIGLLNGFFIAHLRLDQLVMTLAMMGIVRSVSLLINDGRILTSVPPPFQLVTTEAFSMPIVVICAFLMVVAFDFLFKNHVLFRRLYSVGGNSDAADRAGIRSKRVILVTYGMAALAAAVVGLMQSGRTLSASPLIFPDLAIEAIAACLIGGSALFGGRGSVIGATLGLLALAATRNLIVILGISVYWRDLAVGLLLIAAVALQLSFRRRLAAKTTEGEQ